MVGQSAPARRAGESACDFSDAARRAGVRIGTLLLGWVLVFVPARPAAGQERRGPPVARAGPADSPADLEVHEQPLVDRGAYAHFLGALAYGRGLRFNNPYRLATVLGSNAESLSLTAPYADVSAAVAFGEPDGFQQGAALHASIALSGVPQEVVTPAYLALYRFSPRWLGYARAGIPLVLEPDFGPGAELGVGGGFLVTAGLGVTAELVGSLFYGAATEARSVTTIPVVSLQLGVLVDYEVLP